MKIAVVCAPGVGDAVIFQIAVHHLTRAGHEVFLFSPHSFGKWFPPVKTADLLEVDAIFLQHDNTEKAKQIYELDRAVYTFYGAHQLGKHSPLKAGFDFVASQDHTMVDNVVAALQSLFHIDSTRENGFTPPAGLIYRRYAKRIAIHKTSGHPHRNWPHFEQFGRWAESAGYEPVFLPQFFTLEELTSFLYESGFFLGNDSGPGHLASCLKIPNLVIGREERHMRHWRPGWGGEILTPPRWIPNWKGFRIRENYWKQWISVRKVINTFKNKVSQL